MQAFFLFQIHQLKIIYYFVYSVCVWLKNNCCKVCKRERNKGIEFNKFQNIFECNKKRKWNMLGYVPSVLSRDSKTMTDIFFSCVSSSSSFSLLASLFFWWFAKRFQIAFYLFAHTYKCRITWNVIHIHSACFMYMWIHKMKCT